MSGSSSIRLLFDADILIKLAIFDCFVECIEVSGLELSECATMRSMTRSAGVDHPVVRDQKAGVGKPSRRLFAVLKAIGTIDKMDESERALAAEINATSQQLGLQVDGGEALLISVSVHRCIPYLSTGDKKAVRCLPVLAERIHALGNMRGRIIPLELLLLRLVRAKGVAAIFERLEVGKDREGAIAALIADAGCDQAAFEAGLMKYLAQLEMLAPGFVCS